MKIPPSYPGYAEASPIQWQRWKKGLMAGCSMMAAITFFLWPEQKSMKTLLFGFWALGFPAGIWLMLLAIRFFFYQLNAYGHDRYQAVVDEHLERWWENRSLSLPVKKAVMIGSLGDKQDIWANLLVSPPTAPLPKSDKWQGETLACPLLLGTGNTRTVALARLLAHQVLAMEELKTKEMLRFDAVAWYGNEESQTAFLTILRQENIQFAGKVIPLADIKDMDGLIDLFYQQSPKIRRILCAGVACHDPSSEGEPAGEVGFAWLIEPEGQMGIYRPEIFMPEKDDPKILTQQLMRYASLSEIPSVCLAMDPDSMEAVLPGGWSAVEHQLAPYFGELGQFAPFIAMTQSVLHSVEHQQSCGWMASYSEKNIEQKNFVTGVVAHYGKT
ncbi:hypothetical protein [Xenorhabdus szentirmaii]|uniref:Type VI secretion protein n=1 Tax=Xenorhabdus szentirmaii TaxID=290112 RepID=A0AAW3Z0F3_9GAMM|nr:MULTISPECIES: hypothetical protein [unclassified Xenorhabdus]MBD2801993.1 hypothetical protein [Xenorhabdus sp. M]MBD2825540.1 hypothetical protein [Xenorhabdus sp. 5]